MAVANASVIFPDGLSSNLKVIAGVHTTVAAADTVTFPGITKVVSIAVCLGEDQADALMSATAAPSGTGVVIKTWKTSGTDPTPIAADAFSKKVNYVAVGY